MPKDDFLWSDLWSGLDSMVVSERVRKAIEDIALSVHPSHYREYFGYALWFYKGTGFRVLQLVYPTVEGIWPWDVAASEWFRARQPLLDNPSNRK